MWNILKESASFIGRWCLQTKVKLQSAIVIWTNAVKTMELLLNSSPDTAIGVSIRTFQYAFIASLTILVKSYLASYERNMLIHTSNPSYSLYNC